MRCFDDALPMGRRRQTSLLLAAVAWLLAAACLLAAHLAAAATFAGSSAGLMDISADGALLACSNRDSGTVTIVDLKENRKLREVKVGEGKDKNLCGFVVLLTDDADAGAKKLAKLAEEQKIKNVPLTVFDGTAGPEEYKISKDAAVNVMMWNKSKVKVNHAFAAGKLTADDAKKVAGDTSKILE